MNNVRFKRTYRHKNADCFVRHGESFGNISADVPEGYSSDDPPLTDKGIQMAEKLADCFEKEAIAGIFASPLVRAVQTASPIAEKLGMDMNILPELAEKDTYCVKMHRCSEREPKNVLIS